MARAQVRLGGILSGALYQRWIRWIAMASLLGSLTATTYFWMRREISPKVLKTFNFGDKRFAKYQSVRREWRPRAVSLPPRR